MSKLPVWVEFFHQGFSIGTVEEVVPDEYGLTQTAYVKPGADFYDIEHVMVAKRTMTQPELSDMMGEEEEKE